MLANPIPMMAQVAEDKLAGMNVREKSYSD
jgi:hypothetical protein